MLKLKNGGIVKRHYTIFPDIQYLDGKPGEEFVIRDSSKEKFVTLDIAFHKKFKKISCRIRFKLCQSL